MKRILACFLSSLFLLTTGEARTFPSSGKKLHYQFSKQQIRFDGQRKAGDRGRLRCYDLQKDSMWTVDRPWASSRTERNGLPLDSNYVFNYDISSWTFGPKLTLILEMKVEKRGEEAFGPIWLCSHKDAQDKGYIPSGPTKTMSCTSRERQARKTLPSLPSASACPASLTSIRLSS